MDLAMECAVGWGARIRTWECRLQRPMPYHLATPQQPLGTMQTTARSSLFPKEQGYFRPLPSICQARSEPDKGVGARHKRGQPPKAGLIHSLRAKMRSSAYYTILALGTKSAPIRVFQTRLWNAANDACFVAAPLFGQKVPVFDHLVHSREVTGSRPTFMSCTPRE